MMANRAWRRGMAREMQKEARRTVLGLPDALTELPRERWPSDSFMHLSGDAERLRVWVSKAMIVQLFNEFGHERISVSRAAIDAQGRFVDGIAWDELQAVKTAIGFGDRCAVEVYPPDRDVVNVANIRHLWLLAEDPVFMWKDKK